LFLEFLGTLPDLNSDLLLLLSRAQTPDRSLGDLCRSGITVDFVQQGSLCVDRCRGLTDLSTDCALLLFSLSWERSMWRCDPTPLISQWRKSENRRLIFLTLISCGLWLRWHRGVTFSFVSVVSIGLVTTECSLEVVFFFIFFKDGDEIVKAKVLVSVVILVVFIENPVSDNVIEGTGLS
jgi:hypothetical protein